MKTMTNKSNWLRCGVVALVAVAGNLFAAAPAYKVDRSIGQKEFKSEPVSIAVDTGDQLHVLLRDGTVASCDADGKITGNFKADMTSAPSAMALADGKLYLLQTKKIEKEMEYQGKKIKRQIPDGVVCGVFDLAGKKISEFNLPEAQSAAAAHFVGKELAVGDFAKSQILFYDLSGSEPKVTQKITKQFRLCCGIFDFCPGPTPGSIVVANLGAFKVQTYTGGVKTAEFGQRGTVFGEISSILKRPRTATLVALEPTEVIHINAELDQLIAQHPDVVRKIIVNLADRLAKTTGDLWTAVEKEDVK